MAEKNEESKRTNWKAEVESMVPKKAAAEEGSEAVKRQGKS